MSIVGTKLQARTLLSSVDIVVVVVVVDIVEMG